MPRRVAIWIDQRQAIVINFDGQQVIGKDELYSEVGPHTHGGGWAQHRIEAHRHEMLKHYYEEVIRHLRPTDEIFILGPGQAKHELVRRVKYHKGLKGKVSSVRGTARLTEREIIAEAEQFFNSASQGSQARVVSETKEDTAGGGAALHGTFSTP